MAQVGIERRLAAILAADVVGYSRLMGNGEVGTLVALKSHRDEVVDPAIAAHHGRVVKVMGDGLLVEFPSVVEATQCAVDIQLLMTKRNAAEPGDRRIEFRIGINLGDIIVEGDDIRGDGVKIAARLEALAEPGGICIRQAVRNQVRDKLPYAYEDMGEIEVKNITRPIRVFRVLLDGDVAASGAAPYPYPWLWPAAAAAAVIIGVVWFEPWLPREEPESIAHMAQPLPDKPSVAVLPFLNLSDDAAQAYFADGMTEDLIADLSKISELFVISRNSSFTYKDTAVKVKQAAEELGVRYVLEGSVRKIGDQVRINTQLIDAISGYHLWADRYDGSMADVFAMQDKVIANIVHAMAIKLTGKNTTATVKAETGVPEAYDAFLLGWELYRRQTPEAGAKAVFQLEKAIALDPS